MELQRYIPFSWGAYVSEFFQVFSLSWAISLSYQVNKVLAIQTPQIEQPKININPFTFICWSICVANIECFCVKILELLTSIIICTSNLYSLVFIDIYIVIVLYFRMQYKYNIIEFHLFSIYYYGFPLFFISGGLLCLFYMRVQIQSIKIQANIHAGIHTRISAIRFNIDDIILFHHRSLEMEWKHFATPSHRL